jgi:SAM-dependent methyltransferase
MINRGFLTLVLLVSSTVPGFSQGVLLGQKIKHYTNSLAPYVASPQQIVDRMLELADPKPNETVYDLGSGDGRILITAVQRYRAKAVGIELSDVLVQSTTDRIQKLGLQNGARVIHADFLQVDLSPADVVTMYLATDTNEMLRPNLEKYLRNGTRVVSHDYAVPGWKATIVDRDLPDGRGHVIYLYRMPQTKK